MTAKPFRFGTVVLGVDGSGSLAEWREVAWRAEGLGNSSLLLGDHVLSYLPAGGASPLLALAAAASVTQRLRLGTLVLANDFRHPAVVAKDAASLDVLSGGRLELGLGAGWAEPEYERLGLPFDPAGVRVERLAEALAIVKAAWAGEPFDFSGAHYTIRGYAGLPHPMQQPRPPVMVGGGSPRVLRLAGREADIVGIHFDTRALGRIAADTVAERTRRKIEWVKQGAGDRFADLELQMMCDIRITNHGGPGSSAWIAAGTVDAVCEELHRRRDEWGVSYYVVPETSYESAAPIVARLAGS